MSQSVRTPPAAAGGFAFTEIVSLTTLGFAGAALSGTPAIGLAAAMVFGAGRRWGGQAGWASAVPAVAATLLLAPWMERPIGAGALLGIVLATTAAAALGSLLRAREAAGEAASMQDPLPPRLEDVLPPATPPAQPAVQPGRRRSTGAQWLVPLGRDEQEALAGPDVISRFLRDVRDALGVDEAVFWQSASAGGPLEEHATSAVSLETSFCFVEPQHLEIASRIGMERLVLGSDDSSPDLFLAAPVGKGENLLGVLGVYAADRQRAGRERLKPWMGRYASHMALLLTLLADVRAARRYRRRNQEIMEAIKRIQNPLELGELCAAICESALQVASASRAAFVAWQADAHDGTALGLSPGHPLPQNFRISAQSAVGRACADGQRFTLRDAFRGPLRERIYGEGEPDRPIGSLGIVPVVRAREVLGAIVVEGDAASQITAVEVDKLMLIAVAASVALENTEQFSMIRERARRDELTGLANRRAFNERLSQLIVESDRFGQPAALILVDMDNFKRINDSEGHDAGDEVLRQVAKTLVAAVRSVDTCSRYGGEELAVLLPQTDLAAAAEVAERIRSMIAALTVPVRGKAIRVTASVGVAAYPECAPRGEYLFRVADRALYEAKAAGKDCVRAASLSVTSTK